MRVSILSKGNVILGDLMQRRIHRRGFVTIQTIVEIVLATCREEVIKKFHVLKQVSSRRVIHLG